MSMTLPVDKMVTIIRAFTYEMALFAAVLPTPQRDTMAVASAVLPASDQQYPLQAPNDI